MQSPAPCFNGYFLKLLNISHAWRLSASTMQSPCFDGYFLKLFDTFQCCALIASTMQSLALMYTFWNFWTFFQSWVLIASTMQSLSPCFDVCFLKLLNIFSILNTDCLNHAIISWTKHFLNILQTACWLHPMLLSLGIVPLGGWSSGKYGTLCYSSVLSVLCDTLLYGRSG